MSKERNGLQMALGKDVLGDRASLKRAVLVAIYFSMPSNQNGREGSSNVIPQKIIPWGDNAEPRVYISPYTLKRNIRNYWIKQGLPVGYRESAGLIKEVDDNGTVEIDTNEANNSGKVKFYYYLDYDLFGWVHAKESKGNNKGDDSENRSSKGSSVARPGPINTWGAVSMETLHDFIDFNTSIKNANEDSEGGGIFNRSISKEFYFTSFSINPDLIGVDVMVKDGRPKPVYIDDKEEKTNLKRGHYNEDEDLLNRKNRLEKFLEAVKYAMQKDFGPRDRPVCVFAGVAIADKHYPTIDKDLFALIGKKDGIIIEDGMRLKFGNKAMNLLKSNGVGSDSQNSRSSTEDKKDVFKVYHIDPHFVDLDKVQDPNEILCNISDIAEELIPNRNSSDDVGSQKS